MVYNWRDPGVVYDFPSLTLEFLRFTRVEFERHNALEAVRTVEEGTDLATLSPPSRLEEIAGRNKDRRNTSSVESSPVGGKHRRLTSSYQSAPSRKTISRPSAPLGSSNGAVQSASEANTQRSRFTHEFEIEPENDGEYESGGDYESEEDCENGGENEAMMRTMIIDCSRGLWFD